MNIDLSKITHIHFIGIGGIGISAIARMMLLEGKKVSGQDMQDSEIIHALKDAGAQITVGQSFENIPSDAELIVYTIAIEYYDPALFTALQEGVVPIRSYPQMLTIVSDHKYTIAISGTHGKTTTTGMIAQILLDAGKDPTVIIGSLFQVTTKQMEQNLSRVGTPGERVKRANFDPSVGGRSNFIAGKSDYFVVEACEYRRSFLNINPNILVITNIDADHLDYYKDITDIQNAFRELALKVPSDGFVICDTHGEHIAQVIEDIPAQVIDYQTFFNLQLPLKIPGVHNKIDAAAAEAVAHTIGITKEVAENALSQFPGTWRRFEYKGELPSGAKVYDDYAHHPVEIRATLQGFRELYPKEQGFSLTVIFQPHLFSRTKLLLAEFAESFSDADQVLILPIYYAREEDDGTISSEILASEINKHQSNAEGFSDFASVESIIEKTTFTEKDIIITMGAGEANTISDKLVK